MCSIDLMNSSGSNPRTVRPLGVTVVGIVAVAGGVLSLFGGAVCNFWHGQRTIGSSHHCSFVWVSGAWTWCGTHNGETLGPNVHDCRVPHLHRSWNCRDSLWGDGRGAWWHNSNRCWRAHPRLSYACQCESILWLGRLLPLQMSCRLLELVPSLIS